MKGTLIPWRERMVRPLTRIEEEMEGLMERFFGEEGEWAPFKAFTPLTDVVETEKGFEVSVDLPGFKPEEFSVELREGSLWIAGEKKEEKEEKGKTYHRIERRRGEFRRVIPLGRNVDPEKIVAEYKEGVLKVTVPKVEAVLPKRIEIKS